MDKLNESSVTKLLKLCDMIDSLDIPESQKFNMRMAAASVENAGILQGYKIGFTAGIKEGRELEAMKYLPHNIDNQSVSWESIKK